MTRPSLLLELEYDDAATLSDVLFRLCANGTATITESQKLQLGAVINELGPLLSIPTPHTSQQPTLYEPPSLLGASATTPASEDTASETSENLCGVPISVYTRSQVKPHPGHDDRGEPEITLVKASED